MQEYLAESKLHSFRNLKSVVIKMAMDIIIASESLNYHYEIRHYMMKSSNGNIFRVTGHLCGEFTGPR